MSEPEGTTNTKLYSTQQQLLDNLYAKLNETLENKGTDLNGDGKIDASERLTRTEQFQQAATVYQEIAGLLGQEKAFTEAIGLTLKDVDNIQAFGNSLANIAHQTHGQQQTARVKLNEKSADSVISTFYGLQERALAAANDQISNTANMISTGFNIGALVGTLMVMYGEISGDAEWAEKGQKLIDMAEANAEKQQARIEEKADSFTRVQELKNLPKIDNYAGLGLSEAAALDKGVQDIILNPNETKRAGYLNAQSLVQGADRAVAAGSHFQSSVSAIPQSSGNNQVSSDLAPATLTGLQYRLDN